MESSQGMKAREAERPMYFRRPAGQAKGRQVDPASRDRVRALLSNRF